LSAHPSSVEAVPAPERYFNRELSWLAFNERVLEEACNHKHPLLERLRFLSISGSNLDEFYMVRVAGLRGQVEEGVETLSAERATPMQQLAAIAERADKLMARQQGIWAELRERLAEADFHVLGRDDLTAAEHEWLHQYFMTQVFPVLTPQAIDPAHPFPFVPNRGFTLMFELKRLSDDETLYALLMLPGMLRRFVRLPGASARYISLENTIILFRDQIFPGYELEGSGASRVIRDSDIEVEEEAEDLVRFFKSAIKRRRRGHVIRLKIESSMPEPLKAMVKQAMDVGEFETTEVGGILGIADLSLLVEEDRADLKFEPYSPRFPERIREHGGDCLAAIRAKDIVVHHPYEAFDVVLAFLAQAAADPDVVAIKQTLYRAGKNSPIVRTLIDAAESGKSVTAVVELKARFDEEQNLLWAAELERAGVQVVYGFIEWKTHAKVSMVVRREGNELRTYCHFGTGNYHPVTARIYTDLSYFTASPRLGQDAAQIFNYITGYVPPNRLKSIALSPGGIRAELLKLIDVEIENARAGKPAQVWAKLNSLVDPRIIDKLYEASQAGVEIDLVVRGICCLKPGVPGLSERIRVRSIIGRFLEHSRIVAFANGHELPSREAKLFISSADWMPRNFDRRIEVLVPIENATVHEQILEQVMLANLKDVEQSWTLQQDGTYTRVSTEPGFNLHTYFMTNPSLSGRGAALKGSDSVPRLVLDFAQFRSRFGKAARRLFPLASPDAPVTRADEIRALLEERLWRAEQEGASFLEVEARELLALFDAGDDGEALITCCKVMQQSRRPGDELLEVPAVGEDPAQLKVRYRLPR
jgi:polyphosphate kinase